MAILITKNVPPRLVNIGGILLTRPEPSVAERLECAESLPHIFMTFSNLRVTQFALDHGSIAVMAFNRPNARNAMSLKMLEEFSKFVSDVPNSDLRTLVVSATGDVFCAGADLKERKTFTPAQTSQFLVDWNTCLNRLEGLQIPTIAAVQKLAVGGGLEIALATDLRVFGTDAQVGLPETRLGIIPGAGGTVRLPKLIGYSRAIDIGLTGRRVHAAEALQLGLCNRVADDAEHGALQLARSITDGAPLAIPAAKAAIRGASADWERAMYRTVVNSEDKFEALKAFAEKRSPVWKGR